MFLVAACLNKRSIANHMSKAVLIMLSISLMFASISMALLWCTWLWRFSGNANFFYFQTIVWNAANVLLFINIFSVLNQKIACWRREIEKINKIRQMKLQ